MLKVLKFGGSSMADAHQFAKVKAIVDSDPSRPCGGGQRRRKA